MSNSLNPPPEAGSEWGVRSWQFLNVPHYAPRLEDSLRLSGERGKQDRAFAFLIDPLLDMLDQQIPAGHQGFDLTAALRGPCIPA